MTFVRRRFFTLASGMNPADGRDMSGIGRRTIALVLCGSLCIIFTVVSWCAVRGKSATWDEPSHALTGWLMLNRQDYRLSPDVPPLWEKWIALPMGANALTFDPNSPLYRSFRIKHDLFLWCVQTLYRTAGNDGIALVNRGRAMALVLGVILAILIGRWAWKLAGPTAAVAAMLLYCMDPNFLGHAPLVKNDVAFALLYFATAYAIWRAGQRLTFMNASAVALLTAIAVSVKLSGLLLGPVVFLALLIRACMNEPWIILGKEIYLRSKRVYAVLALCVATGVATYIILWASYGFRFAAGPNGMMMDTAYYIETLKRVQVFIKANGHPQPMDLENWRMPLSTSVVVFLEDKHLLPQAWTSGFVLTQTGDINRGAFLLGLRYSGGHWFYFPLAALFKAPLATIAAVIFAFVIGRRALKRGLLITSANYWTAVAIGVPFVLYAIAIMTANLNIGLRHAFPLYPFAFVAISLAVAKVWETAAPKAGQATKGQVLLLVLAAGLVAESAAAYPDYIAFFNAAFASHRLWLLSDSNFDWGQDLPLIKAWQDKHPDVPLFLEYFGLCDPAAYGIHYINVPGGYLFGPQPVWPAVPGEVAISATDLQGPYSADPANDLASIFRGRKPQEILGHTIYLFDFDPRDFLKDSWPDPARSAPLAVAKDAEHKQE
jgi:hypothetical protein